MEIGNIFRHLLVHNEAFVKSTDATKFLAYATRQNPYITLVTCADSRVQGNILGTDIFNKVFLIRNAGNQVAINRGIYRIFNPCSENPSNAYSGTYRLRRCQVRYSRLYNTIKRNC